MSLTKVSYSMIQGTVVNVLDYGADPTNTTDSAPAIQAAIYNNQNATIYFPTGTYKCASSIILTDAAGNNFQGNLIGENATINFTNAGSASDTDAAMQHGFTAYPVTNAAGGDTSGWRYAIIKGFTINGPTHGACIYLANSFQIVVEQNKTNNSRYGLVTECCINTKVLYNSFSTYTNAGYGMLMTANPHVWYGSASPESSYWNDSPLIQGNGFGTTATNQPLAHILDHGSHAEAIRLVQNNFFISSGVVGGVHYGTQYGYIGRNCNVTMERNWFEDVVFPVRILSTNAVEGTGNLTGVIGAEPSGTYAITNFPDGFSYNGKFKGNWFAKSYQDINVNGINGTCEIADNFSQAMVNGGTHLITTQTTQVLDGGDIVTSVGSYTYKSMTNNTYTPLTNDWVAYTPTVTSSSGSITAYTVNAANYLIVKQKAIQVNLDITIDNNGTGSGSLLVTLPSDFVCVGNGGVLTGVEINATGYMLTGKASGTTATVVTYNNTYPGGTGRRIVISGMYQSY